MKNAAPIRIFRLPKPLLWFNVLSLDAPLVAVVWQDFFARVFSVKLTPAPRIVLALAVWLAYAADRWFDAWKIPTGTLVAPRHRFAREHRWPIATISLVVLCGATFLACFDLPAHFVERGWILAALVGLYFLLNQWPGPTRLLAGLKEFAVGILFATGTVLFIAPKNNAERPFWGACIAWFLLVVLNCYAIACWEEKSDRAGNQESLVTRWPFLAKRFRSVALLVAVFAISTAAWVTSLSRFGLAVALSSAGLATLDWFSPNLDSDFLRTAADLVLFTPLLARFF